MVITVYSPPTNHKIKSSLQLLHAGLLSGHCYQLAALNRNLRSKCWPDFQSRVSSWRKTEQSVLRALVQTIQTCLVSACSCDKIPQRTSLRTARTKDFHRPLKFCLSFSPTLRLLVLFNFPIFTFFLDLFDWIALFWIWFESHLCPARFSLQRYITFNLCL